MSFTDLGAVGAVATYIAGQCTWFVAKVLDWVPGGLGDARNWLANSRNKTYRGTNQKVVTGKAPVVGDVAVFGPGQQGALSAGHVAIVTNVHPNWTFDVREMNFGGGPFKETPRKNLNPSQVLGFIASPSNAAQKPMNYGGTPIMNFLNILGFKPGTTMSDQQAADIAFSHHYTGDMGPLGATNADAITKTASDTVTNVTTAFDSVAGPLGKIAGFVTDPKEWWRVGFVAIGGTFVLIGLVGYFRPALPKVAPIPV